MKAKKLITLALAVLLAVMSVVSVSAAQLTDANPNGKTEVTAKIQGDSGDVTYIITIPDVVDFGTLTIPADNSQDYNRDVEYEVEATLIDGLDPTTQAVAVYVKDQNASQNDPSNADRKFYIANKANTNIKFEYDVYGATGSEVNESTRVNNRDYFTNGYYLTSFNTTGETLDGTLRIAQKQLYGQNIADIAGDYSGYMVFFSAIEDI